MKNIILLIAAFAIQTVASQDVNELSLQEKKNDFFYLFETLEQNYPYFGRYERIYGECWLAKKDSLEDKVNNTRNNEDFLWLIDSMVKSLHDKEADLAPTIHWDYFRSKYGQACLLNPRYIPWVNMLNQSEEKAMYWSGLLDKKEMKAPQPTKEISYRDSVIHSVKIGILGIPSFETENMTDDFQCINEYLYSARDCNYLIIDIQGNKGGSSSYWMEGIVSRLIYTPVYYNRYFAVKEGEQNNLFFPKEMDNRLSTDVTSSFSALPLEFADQTFRLIGETTAFHPFLPIPFKGEIIILTDPAVFSAADEFVCFAQNTSWATVGGEATGGGGVGSDPALIRLPASGIIIRYPALIGLNSNGSLHTEHKMIPDIEINGNDANERLNKLIDRIMCGKISIFAP